MSMTAYTQWAINHPWHVTGPEPRPAVPADCDCLTCEERRTLDALPTAELMRRYSKAWDAGEFLSGIAADILIARGVLPMKVD